MADASIPRKKRTKHCKRCGTLFYRNPKYSDKQWATSHWCSRKCGAWNKGLTKNDDHRLARIGLQSSVISKGRPAWNKGLTKETDSRVALYADSVSLTQRGKTCTPAQLKNLAIGRKWKRGRTAADSPTIAKHAKYLSKIYKGKKNPAHGKRLKAYYKEHPEDHPNAKLARKTKGHGKTYIERLVSEYLDELGIGYEFNKRVGTKWPDFQLPDHALIVEADGEFWHHDMVAEKKRDEYLRQRGWDVLHLTGSKICQDPQWCKQTILRLVENNELSK